MRKRKKRLKPRGEAIIAFMGILFFVTTVLVSVFWRYSPAANSVYYVSDSEKAALVQSGEVQSVVVNINIATAEELTVLEGVGEVLAQRIVDYRSKHGNFDSVDELLNVEGIGEKKLEAIRLYVVC